MKGIQLAIIFCVCLSATLYGGKVDTTTAELVAGHYYLSRISSSNQPHLKSLSIEDVKLHLIHQEFGAADSTEGLKSTSSLPLYYVFNVDHDKGFIIVSADDRIYPVLGYSFHGRFSPDNQPPAFRAWMNHYKDQIQEVISRDLGLNTSSPFPGEWAKYSSGIIPDVDYELSAVGPLLSTIWGQGCYYNKFCPEDDRGPCGKVWAGCVAVGMAQIMNYWNIPSTSNASAGYEDTLNYDADDEVIPGSAYGQIPGFVSTPYDWVNMPDSLISQSTVVQVDAVAELLKHCGVAIEMNYGPFGSPASIRAARDALVSIFKYAPAAQLVRGKDFTDSEWHNVLVNELDHGRPMLYVGNDGEDAGHAFVCDGYMGSSEFHFNWGWRGIFQENYFYLDDLTPGDDNYSENQWAVIGIYPDNLTSDPCDNVLTISGMGTGFTQTFMGGGAGVWDIGVCGFETPGMEQVYSFVAPESGTYSITVTTASGYVDYFWRATTCGESDWNCIGDINDTGQYGSMNWTEGTTYYILLDDEDSQTGVHQFHINTGSLILSYDSHEIDDDQSTSWGDDDGKAEPGESIELTVTLLNSGSEAVHYVTAILFTADPDIAITDDTVNYGTIDGGTVKGVSDFDFDVSITCPDKDILFVLDITADEGDWTDTFYVHIYSDVEVNPCDHVLAIDGCGTDHTQTFTGGGTGVWDITSCNYNTPGMEQVYSFVAPESGNYSITVTSASGFVDYFWRASGCGESGWTCILDIDNAGTYGSMNWTADATYYILLDDVDTWTGTHQFYINCGSPILAYDSHEIDDDKENGSSGDDDGLAEPGESIELDVTLLNSGSEAAHNVTAILSTTDPDITITDDTLNFGTIAGGAALRNNDFDFDVSLTCPIKDVLFTLDITADEGNWTDTFSVHIYGSSVSNPCNNVIAISGTGAGYAQTYMGGGSGVWDINSCGYHTPGLEQVYSFIAPASGTYSIDVASADGHVNYSWQASGCDESGWTCISNIAYPGTYGAMSWIAGTTYYILLDDKDSITDTHRFHINLGEPVLEYYGYEIDDDKENGSSGDDDGLPETGESIELSVILHNSGRGAAHLVKAILSTTDPDITITENELSCEMIDAGRSERVADFDFDVSMTCPEKYVLFSLDITADEGDWNASFYVHIYDTTMDPCDSVIAIYGCGESHTQTFTGEGAGVWDLAGCGFSTPGMEQVYGFIAPESGDYRIDVTNASGSVDYFWKASLCRDTGWECIESISNTGQYGSMDWTRGKTYYILLDNENITNVTHEFNIHCASVGIKDKQLFVNDLYIYPNPTEDWLNISVPDDLKGEVLVTITDVMGLTVYAGSMEGLSAKQDQALNISTLEEGIYFIRLSGREFDRILRFVRY